MYFTFISFCLIKALSVCSDYCRAVWDVGCRIGSGPGRNRRRPGESIPARALPNAKSVRGAPHQPGGHQLPRSDSRSASWLVDDVHQARITWGVQECMVNVGKYKWGSLF